MISVAKDKLIRVPGGVVTFLEKRIGKRPNPVTIWRWATKGKRGVVLKTTNICGSRYTTSECLDEFCQAVADAQTQSTGTPSILNSARQAKRQEAVKREAKEMGLG